MIFDPNSELGLEYVLEELARRYVFDQAERMVKPAAEGVLPRFVLGRAAEGCIWRFSAELSPSLVRSVAKLAGRELSLIHI